MKRKNFSYAFATVEQIVEKFKSSSAQAIYSARNAWKDDEEVSARIEEAYFQYKIAKFKQSNKKYALQDD